MKYAIQKCEFEDAAMVRWVMQLSQYIFNIEFVYGDKNSFTDMLSREFLLEHSVLSCSFMRRTDDHIEIETPTGWVRYELEAPLLIHDESWYPIKEIRHRKGIPYLWTKIMQNEMNNEAVEALDYLEHIGSIMYVLQKRDDDEDCIESCHITFRRFGNHFHRENYDIDRQRDAFFEGMNLQNYASNLFYCMQFNFSFEGMTVEALEQDDPTPDWFLEWWRIYELSTLVIKPYTLHMLKIPGFTEPRAHMNGILNSI